MSYLSLFFLLSLLSQAREPLDVIIGEALCDPVLSDAEAGGRHRLALYFAFSNQMAQAGAAITAGYGQLADGPSLLAWQKRMRANVSESLGGFPERTDLNARVTGVVEMKDCRVEKILFESRPGFYVTALLYLPHTARFPPPYPAVLIPCGHSKNGKAAIKYQNGAVLASANGIAAMIFDSIDQGERAQGSIGIGTAGHNNVGVNAALIGWNTATIMIWDGMRALDYLAGRPDIDASGLGCMGNSGGGTQTSYLAALDGALAAAGGGVCHVPG